MPPNQYLYGHRESHEVGSKIRIGKVRTGRSAW